MKEQYIEFAKENLPEHELIRCKSMAEQAVELNKKFNMSSSLNDEQLFGVMLLHTYMRMTGNPVNHLEDKFGEVVAEYVFAIGPHMDEREDNEYHNYKRIGHNRDFLYYKIILRCTEITASINMGDIETFKRHINAQARFKRVIRTYFKSEFNSILQYSSELIKQGKKDIYR